MSTYLDSYDQIGLVTSTLSNTGQKQINVQPQNYNIETASSNGSQFTQELSTSQCMDFEEISNNYNSDFLLDSSESIHRFNEQLELDNNATKKKRKIANSREPAVPEENVNTSRNVHKRLCVMDDTRGDKHLQIPNNQYNVNDDDPFPYLYAHSSSHITHTNNTYDNLNNCSTNKFPHINRNFQHSTVSKHIIAETNVDRDFNSLLVDDVPWPNIQSICEPDNEAKLTIDTVAADKDYKHSINTNRSHNINSSAVAANIIPTHTEYDNVIQPPVLIPIQSYQNVDDTNSIYKLTTAEPLNEYISSSTPVEISNNSDLYKNWDKLMENIKNTTNINEKVNDRVNNDDVALTVNQISDAKVDIVTNKEIITITDLINDNNNEDDVDLNNQNADLLLNQINDEKVDIVSSKEIITITDLINDNNNEDDVDLNNQNAALIVNQISDEKTDIVSSKEIITITDLINDNNNEDDVDLNNQNAALTLNQINNEKTNIDTKKEIIVITDLINDNNNYNKYDVDQNNQNTALIVYQINDEKGDIVSKKEIIVNYTDKFSDSNSKNDNADNISSCSSDTGNSDSSTDIKQITWIGKPIRKLKYLTFYKQIEILCEGNVTDIIAIADSVSVKSNEKHVRYYGKINALFEVKNGEKRKSMTKLMWYYQTKDIVKEVPGILKLSDNALFTSNHYTDVATCTIVGHIHLYLFAKYRNLRTKNYKMDFYVAGNYNTTTKKLRYLKNASL